FRAVSGIAEARPRRRQKEIDGPHSRTRHVDRSETRSGHRGPVFSSALGEWLRQGACSFDRRKCSLLDAPRLCKYRMRLGDSSSWHYISQLCRNRITSVCDLFCYLRYIQQGLVRNSIHEVYWEVIRRRRCIALARLGIGPSSS
ncbi:unnamed protein product, partial [Ixodes pacificus]